jgi:Domain of unknown function (DUF4303)
MARNHVIDYEAFLSRLVVGLRKAWQEVRSKRTGETFYLFGIETDSDITDLYPLCNTEEQFVADGGRRKPSIGKWFMDDDAALYRAGRKHTKALAEEVNRYVFEDHSKDPKGAFRDRKRRLLNVFEKALVKLDEEGLFGTGRKRSKVLLQITIVDPSDAEWRYMLKVIKRVNPPESTAAFFALVGQQEQERAAERTGERSVVALATEFLRRENRPFGRRTGVYPVRNEAIYPLLTGMLGQKETPKELWQVMFDGRDAGAGPIVVVVDPLTGNCAIEP